MKIKCKSIDNPRYSSNRSFMDFAFILICCIMLFFIQTLVKIQKKNQGIQHKAEFIITMTWDKKDVNDMDLWLKDPNGNIIYYKDKKSNAMFLDRDDLGQGNDKIVINGQEKIIEINQEIISIRAIVPGRWILAVHFYKRYDKNPPGTKIPVEIQMSKMNPEVKIVFNETREMSYTWQETTVAIFDMTADGKIENIELMGQMPMVHERIPVPTWTPDRNGDGEPDVSPNSGLMPPDMMPSGETLRRNQEAIRSLEEQRNRNVVPDNNGGV